MTDEEAAVMLLKFGWDPAGVAFVLDLDKDEVLAMKWELE